MRVGHVLAYTAAFLALTTAGQLSLEPGKELPFLWPAAGVTVAWVLRAPTRRDVLIATGVISTTTVLFFGLVGIPVVGSVLLAVGTVVIAVLPRVVIGVFRRAGVGPGHAAGRTAITTPTDFVLVLAATVAGGAGSSVVLAAAVLGSGGRLSGSQLLGWLFGNTVGAFIVGASLLTVQGARQAGRPGRWWSRPVEKFVLFAAALGGTLLLFWPGQLLPLPFLMMMIVVRAGMRLRPPAAALLGLLLVATTVVLVRFFAGGPFATIRPASLEILVLQIYCGVVFTLGLLISLVAAERQDLSDRLVASERIAVDDAARLRAVTDNTGEGVVVIDETGRNLFRNPVAERLLGSIGELRNDRREVPIGKLYGMDGRLLGFEELPMARALAGESVRGFPVRHRALGASRTWAVDAVPIRRDADGRPDRVLILIHDVTAEYERVEQLESFAATVAHDLQSPITGVIGWTETAVDQLDRSDRPGSAAVSPADLRATLDRIGRSARRAQDLVNDLLGYASARTAALEYQPVDLDELLDEVIRELTEQEADQRPGPPPRIHRVRLGQLHGDRSMLRQLLVNLLGNAIKYADPGRPPRVSVDGHRSHGTLTLEISDNGIGVPSDQRELIFEAFHRGRVPRHYPGTGLGLAICTQVVRRHGGTIAVRDSVPGPGSTFVVTFPDRSSPSGRSGGSDRADRADQADQGDQGDRADRADRARSAPAAGSRSATGR